MTIKEMWVEGPTTDRQMIGGMLQHMDDEWVVLRDAYWVYSLPGGGGVVDEPILDNRWDTVCLPREDIDFLYSRLDDWAQRRRLVSFPPMKSEPRPEFIGLRNFLQSFVFPPAAAAPMEVDA